MKCKYCQTELEEGMTLCPGCGAELEAAEETAVEVPVAEPVTEEPAEAAAPEIKEGIKATPGKIALALWPASWCWRCWLRWF